MVKIPFEMRKLKFIVKVTNALTKLAIEASNKAMVCLFLPFQTRVNIQKLVNIDNPLIVIAYGFLKRKLIVSCIPTDPARKI